MPRPHHGSSAGHPGPRRDPHSPPSPAPPRVTSAATLLLNATYEPLCVVSSRRAIVLVLAEKAVSVDCAQEEVHSESVTLPVPVVVRLTRYVRVPYPAQVPLSRRAVFTRDGSICVYCGSSATSIDHVVPRSRGGTHTWDNVVAACRRCNHTKADRSLAELGWKLPNPPRTPSGAAWRLLGARAVDPRWREWLGVPESVSA
ncbi:HNH endonuclease [Geodermatophilus sabuli]|uniref:5-methylcytosine-specific restriction endonuclease McrA n=1 Tax=Geodermatophilus sabuli TaxID=1564158 RepID=A0A285E6G9_9ACTN|nr:HNH endonuclease [Geodermatophilus sabuli]MBB3082671.1 5-methylcytosine-specific restriction endonuclease McrA [Geodermatophilus sabuli]SNX94463.1 5-methylcytosine-specific restriction endonuclease McrA [Geodermatophilus sabuli]